jgi:hypothetical protein
LTSPSSSRRRRLIAASSLGAATVLLVVGIGYGLLGASHAFLEAKPTPMALSFLPAVQLSDALAQHSVGGPWELLSAAAQQSSEGFHATPAPSPPQNCSPASALPAVPADSDVLLASGSGRYWMLDYLGPNGSYLWIIVVDGSAQVAELSPASEHCIPSGYIAHLNQSQLRDSPDVVHALGSNWTQFSKNHTVQGSLMFLGNTGFWSLSATGCPFNGTGLFRMPVGPDFEGTVNAATLNVIAAMPYGPSTCS